MPPYPNLKNRVEKFYLDPTTHSPNSPLPILLYRNVLPIPYNEESATKALEKHGGWEKRGAWGYSLNPHFHPNTHEGYGVFQGSSTLKVGRGRFDDSGGVYIPVKAGDVIILPAGTTHVNSDSEGYKFIGIYPKEAPRWRNEFGKKPVDLPTIQKVIMSVEMPSVDPVYGADGPLVPLWTEAGSGMVEGPVAKL